MPQYSPALYAHKGTLSADRPTSHGMRTGLATPLQHRRFDDPFTYACADAGRIDIFFQMLGVAIFRCPLSLLSALQPCGPFPQRALPRVSGTTDHSATLTARPAPYGVPVAVCLSTDRASRVATSLIFHACQHQYPGEPSWYVCRSLPKTCPSSPYRRKGRHPHCWFVSVRKYLAPCIRGHYRSTKPTPPKCDKSNPLENQLIRCRR